MVSILRRLRDDSHRPGSNDATRGARLAGWRRTTMTGSAGISRRSILNGISATAIAGLAPVPAEALGRRRLSSGPTTDAGPEQLGVREPDGLHTRSAIFGAELQYFRMTPIDVGKRLELCRQAAYSIIQAYVPWNVHENSKGHLDWVGETHPVIVSDHADEYQIETPDQEVEAGGAKSRVVANTDLRAFLSECRRLNFDVILRPGPFISDEWRNGGLPDWFLTDNAPDVYERGADGSPLMPGDPFGSPAGSITGGGPLFYFPSPSYAAPAYRSAAKAWLRDFAKFVRPWLATSGGPVIGVQVDDETCYFYRFGAFECDYHPAVLRAWDRHSGGRQAPTAWPDQSAGVTALRPALEWQAFKAEQIGGYLAALAHDLRGGGVDVPITHETELSLTPSGDMTDDARAVLLTAEFYSGGSSAKTLPANELTAQACRAATRHRGRPWATEMNNGDVGLYNLLIGEEVVGGLQFTYTEGVPDGALAAFAQFGRTLRTAGKQLTQARRRADVAIVWDDRLAYLPFDTRKRGFRTDGRRTIENHVPALMALLIQAGYSVDLIDTHVARTADYRRYPTIFLCATDLLPAKAQHDLVTFVRAGGRLVTWPIVPSYDESLRPCSTLERHLYPHRELRRIGGGRHHVDLLGHRVPVWRGVRLVDRPKGAQALARHRGEDCGYVHRVGRGEAIYLGSYLAADNVIGREGEIFEEQSLPADPAGREQALKSLLGKAFGPHGPDLIVASGRVPANAKSLIVYQYSNERRGGEVISGGVVAAWTGRRVIGLAELNTAETGPRKPIPFPDHPIRIAHINAVRRLAAVRPQLRVSDRRIQARVLDGGSSGAATISALNRSEAPVHVSLHTSVAGRRLRLPAAGTFVLPAGVGMLLPIGYDIGHGLTITRSTCQLIDVSRPAGKRAVDIRVWSPQGGEVWIKRAGGRRAHRYEAAAGERIVRVLDRS